MHVKIILPPTPRYSCEKEFVEKAGGKNRALRMVRRVGHSLQAQSIFLEDRGGVGELKVDRVLRFIASKISV